MCAVIHSKTHCNTDKAKATCKAYRSTENHKISQARWNQSTKGKATKKAYAQTNKYKKYRHSDEFIKHQKEYDKLRANDPDIRSRRQKSLKDYQQTDAFKKSVIKYNQSSKGQMRVKRGNYNRRIRINTARIYYSAEELRNRFNHFGNRCVYCGGEYQSIDHVIPLSDGGYDAIYNLVPACIRCNSSKNNHALQDWYPKQDFYNNEQMELILNTVGG